MQQTPQTQSLLRLAQYLHTNGQPVPVDVLGRLLAAGIDVKRYQ